MGIHEMIRAIFMVRRPKVILSNEFLLMICSFSTLQRYVTAHTHLNPHSNKRFDQWKMMDQILKNLSEESPAFITE